MYLKWHKVIIHPCWHSQRKRWVMDTLLILLQHSRTESVHPGHSGGADCAHQTGSEHGVAGSQCQNQLKVQTKSGLWPSLLPQYGSSVSPLPNPDTVLLHLQCFGSPCTLLCSLATQLRFVLVPFNVNKQHALFLLNKKDLGSVCSLA